MEPNDVNGILNVLKPPGMTSHDVVWFIRHQMRMKKAGHTGTLDPGVAGVLPVCLGKATKVIEYMSGDIKQYRAEVTFGRSTDTQDGFGAVINEKDASNLTESRVEEVFLSLRGEQQQIPPMVSALKHKGRKLYELAREGITIEREPRPIRILEIRPIRFTGFGTAKPVVLFDIKCSKGTYIRTICHDVGDILGVGGYMSFLVRTGTGMFPITEALTLEEISELIRAGAIRDKVMSVDRALPFEPVWVYDNVVNSVMHGNRVYPAGIEAGYEKLVAGQLVKIMNSNAGCLAVARVISEKTDEVSDPVKSGVLHHNNRYIIQPVKLLC